MIRRWLVVGLLPLGMLLTAGCEDNEGRGELLAGPDIDVHCAGQRSSSAAAIPKGSIGDSTVKVDCAAP